MKDYKFVFKVSKFLLIRSPSLLLLISPRLISKGTEAPEHCFHVSMETEPHWGPRLFVLYSEAPNNGPKWNRKRTVDGEKRGREEHNKNTGNAFIMTSPLFPTLVIFLGSPQHLFTGIKLALGNLQRPSSPAWMAFLLRNSGLFLGPQKAWVI